MKTIILGPAGEMGSAMVACTYVRPGVELIGAVGPRGRGYIGKFSWPPTLKNFNLLFELIKSAVSKIDQQADIDIIDMHDNMELDAPIDTSKQIAEIISKELQFKGKDYTYGRKGDRKKKSK